MDSDLVVNLGALLVAAGALASSTFLTWRALRFNRSATHIPVLVDMFRQHRSPDFIQKEELVWAHMKDHEEALGFSNLPADIRQQATEVTLFYLTLSYLTEWELIDREIVSLQVKYRMLKTWAAVEGHVRGERALRGGEFTFLNTREIFVRKVRNFDPQAIAERMNEQRN